MVVRLGLIGSSEGNGHPYSFSAIFNGYDEPSLRRAGWGVIANYLQGRPAEAFGIDGFAVTHVWSSEAGEADHIAASGLVPTVLSSVDEMLGVVDGVIIARDDPESHWPLARPFLEVGVPVLVDKPLTVDASELEDFAPYLASGRLFSSSSMRFSAELSGMATDGTVLTAAGSGPKDWRRYGVHLLEGILPYVDVGRATTITRHRGAHESFSVETSGGAILRFDLYGDAPVGFQFHRVSSEGSVTLEVTDNFSMFKRMLEAFCGQIVSGQPAVAPVETIDVLALVIAGHRCEPGETRRLDGPSCGQFGSVS